MDLNDSLKEKLELKRKEMEEKQKLADERVQKNQEGALKRAEEQKRF